MPRFTAGKISFLLLAISLSVIFLSACSTSVDSFLSELPLGEASTGEDDIHLFDQNSNVIIIEEIVIGLQLSELP